MIRRAFLAGLALAALAQAIDIQVAARGPLIDLARGARWGVAGAGGVNAAFVVVPWVRDSGYCVVIRNNNTVTPHTFSLGVFHTVDQTQAEFGLTTYPSPVSSRWIQDFAPSGGMTLAASQTYSTWVNPGNAARLAVVLSSSIAGAGGPDTADITLIQSREPCGFASKSLGASCTAHSLYDIAGAGRTTVVSMTAGGPEVLYLCHWSWAAAALTDVRLVAGTGANCVTDPLPITGWYHDVKYLSLDFPPGAMRSYQGRSLCVEQLGAPASGGVIVTGVQ